MFLDKNFKNLPMLSTWTKNMYLGIAFFFFFFHFFDEFLILKMFAKKILKIIFWSKH